MNRLSPRLRSLLIALLCLVPGIFAGAQTYTSIVVIGDSLSDTGNDAAVSAALYTVNAQVPGPATGYTNGRFTDGLDTSPAARLYQGVWIEQLAAKFPAKPPVINSLAGGSNYAYGFATTNSGTSPFTYGPNNVFSFPVNNMGLQLSTYLATKPTITNKTLFVVWGGANDLIAATGSSDIINAATRDLAIVQQLISAGATDFIIPNLPPLGLVPRFNGSPSTSLPATAACQAFDQALAAGIASLPAANPGKTLHLYQLDTYTLFNTIVGPPIYPGFANVTAQSQGMTTVNPDTYLFWDNLHPTTYGHSIIASTAATLIGTPVVTTSAVTSSSASANLNSTVTLTASVTATSGTAMGTVTFMDGTTVLGTGFLSGTTATATTTFATSTLLAGPHTITAVYTGVNGYVSSTSPVFTETVIAPAYAPSLLPASLTLTRGTSSSTGLSITPVGGYTGSFTIACGTLPAHITCSLFNPTLAVTTAAAAVTTVTITSGPTLSLLQAPAPWKAAQFVLAFTFPTMIGGLALWRRRTRSLPLLALLLMLSAGALLGLGGCSSSGPDYSHDAAVGTYQVPIVVTPTTGSASTVNLTVVVQ